MPYIHPEDRDAFEPKLERRITAPDQLNFSVTRLIDDYLSNNRLDYQTLNDVIGVLECVKLEVYRRIAAPYEDQKLALNGDVYKIKVRPFGKVK